MARVNLANEHHGTVWACQTATFDDALPVGVGDLGLLQRAPVLAVAVDDAVAGDGDVGGAIGRERRLAAAGVESLERGLDQGIEVFVGSKLYDGALLPLHGK